MVETMSLTCPTCGAKLEVTEDMDRFACLHCGNEMLVMRRGGTASLKPIVEQLERVRDGASRTASELAIDRLDKEIVALLSQRKGEFGSGCAITLIVFGLLFGGYGLLMVIFSLPSPSSLPVAPETLWIGPTMILIAIGLFVFAYISESGLKSKRNLLDSLIAQKIQERRRHEEVVTTGPEG